MRTAITAKNSKLFVVGDLYRAVIVSDVLFPLNTTVYFLVNFSYTSATAQEMALTPPQKILLSTNRRSFKSIFPFFP